MTPVVNDIPNGVEYAYLDYHTAGPVIQLRDFHRDRAGNLTCDLTAFCMKIDTMTSIAGIRWNMSSLSTRKQLARGIKDAYLDIEATYFEWDRLLADTALRALTHYRNGHEIEDIWPQDDVPKPTYLINPILPLHQPTIIFGDGGAGKGHLAMTLALIAQLPFLDNPLGLQPQESPTNCLYADYESDHYSFERTLTGLCKGFDINCGIKRIQMAVPIAEATEQLLNRMTADNTGLLIVDSLGPAAGGNINDAEQAIKLFSALRQLQNVTVLIIAHTSKDPLTKNKSVFGSVFFTNLARSVWEVKKAQEVDSPDMVVALKHTKYNARRQLPLGLCFTFNDDTGSIMAARQDLTDTQLITELPLYLQIKELLLNGSLTKLEIAEALGLTETEIKPTLYKYKKLFINLDGGNTWGVVAEGGSY